MGRLFILFLIFPVLGEPGRVEAHPALFTSSQIYIQPDGQYQLFLSFDLLAFALQKTSVEIGDPPMNALLDGPPAGLDAKLTEARAYFQTNLQTETDRGPTTVKQLKFPDLAEVQQWKASGVTPRLPVVARVEVDGTLPAGAMQVRFKFPIYLGSVVLTVTRPDGEVYDESIETGSFSSQIQLQLAGARPTPSVKTAASGPWYQSIELGLSQWSAGGVQVSCLILTFFLFGLRFRDQLGQLIIFQATSSFSLALTVFGPWSPPSMIQPIFPLMIAGLAMDNLVSKKLGLRRIGGVILSGLIYGAGTGVIFQEFGLATLHRFRNLLGFDMGLLLGQIIVLAGAWLALGWFRKSPEYPRRVIIPISLLLMVLSLYWFFHSLTPYL